MSWSRDHESSAGQSAMRTAGADRFLQVFGLVVLAALIVYLLPWLERDQLYFFIEGHSEYVFLAIALAACLIRLHALEDKSERRFWACISVSLTFWVAVVGLYLLAPSSIGTLAGDIAVDLLYAMFYVFLIVAGELAPTQVDTSVEGIRARRIRVVSGVGTLLMIFLYFVVLPATISYDTYATWVPSLYMFVVLNLFLAIRFVHLLRATSSRRYRWVYRFLAAATATWAVVDTLECLTWLGRLDLEAGAAIELLWLLPFAFVVLAARIHEHVPEATVTRDGPTDTPVDPLRGTVPLILMALFLPALHIALHATDLLDPSTRQARDLLVLGHLAAFGPLVVMQHRLLGRANRELQQHLDVANERLQHAAKLEAVGTLAGGVAHDFNNLLTAVVGYADLAVERQERGEGVVDHLEHIQQAANRATELTRQLLALGRQQLLRPKLVNLNQLIQGIDTLLRTSVGEQVELALGLDPRLGRVRVDPGQIEQVLVNLAINARDAMPRGGRLSITTTNVWLGELAVIDTDAEAGPFVSLSVTDTGEGMDDETRLHAFDPFFTTKEPGAGTGLGLSVTYGIVRQSGGLIALDSAPGEGTTCEILLPCVAEGLEREPDPSPQGRAEPGHETILLVEDDEMVRGLAKEALQVEGYRVLEAANGPQALEILEGHHSVDILVSDVVLPGLSGPELAERLAILEPTLKVLFMSGYVGKEDRFRGGLEPDTNFLQKPFTGPDLARRVRELLDGS